MFRELEFNVALNNLSDICRLNQVALSDTNGQGTLSQYEAGAEVYGSLGNHKRKERAIVGYEHVKIITLDSYVAQHNIKHIDLIKMDIEGAELLAMKGAKCVLSQGLVQAIVLELSDTNTVGFGYKASEIWDYLESLGYTMHCFNKHGRLSGIAKKPADFTQDQNPVAIINKSAV
jgi:FkbM family methyltransferase